MGPGGRVGGAVAALEVGLLLLLQTHCQENYIN